MSALKDLTGQRFGRLVVLRRDQNDRNGKATWRCQCDCGKEVVVVGANLRTGDTKSCGCMHYEFIRNLNVTHGYSKTRLYKVWAHMKERCYNPSNKNYDRYGMRGITICDEWLQDFLKFREWAMANGYDESAPKGQCTIDRIDNNKGYSPDNCRWVDMKTQLSNYSKNIYVEIDGKKQTLRQWADEVGLPYMTIVGRFQRGKKGLDLISKKQKE